MAGLIKSLNITDAILSGFTVHANVYNTFKCAMYKYICIFSTLHNYLHVHVDTTQAFHSPTRCW